MSLLNSDAKLFDISKTQMKEKEGILYLFNLDGLYSNNTSRKNTYNSKSSHVSSKLSKRIDEQTINSFHEEIKEDIKSDYDDEISFTLEKILVTLNIHFKINPAFIW